MDRLIAITNVRKSLLSVVCAKVTRCPITSGCISAPRTETTTPQENETAQTSRGAAGGTRTVARSI